jgi:ATP phosphoribosyltransferase
VETARRFFAGRGIQVRLIRIAGSVEVAPLLGLSHWILDLVESGRTLAENGLVVVDEVCDSTARLVVNRASHKLRLEEHQRLITELEGALAGTRGSPAARSAS